MHTSISNVLVAVFAVCCSNLEVWANFFTCQDTDPTCDNVIDPCLNNGRCCLIDGEPTCDCTPTAGFSGRFCQERPCVPGVDPCLNGGTCTDAGGSFACVCTPQYAGPRCEYEPCNHDKCLNGATCRPYGMTNYLCDCVRDPTGQTVTYKGRHCDVPDPCSPNPCQNGATCRYSSSYSWNYRCIPVDPTRFGGQFGNETTICARENPCLNGGTCSTTVNDYPDPNSYTCSCPPDWGCINCSRPDTCTRGILADDDTTVLVPPEELCLNGGRCQSRCPGGHYCYCTQNFKGPNCRIPRGVHASCCNDPHCRSFDGKNIEYHSPCQSVLVKTCNDATWPVEIPTFQIIGAFGKCYGEYGPTCVNATAIDIDGKLYEITSSKLYVDNDLTTVPVTVTNPADPTGEPLLTITVEKANPVNCLAITTNWGLTVTQCGGCMSVELSYDLYDKITGKVCGLFGNANGKYQDDFAGLSADGFFAANIVIPPKPAGCAGTLGRKKRDVADDLVNPLLLCKDENSTELAKSVCAIINNRTGPFRECYYKNYARIEMYQACLHDMCIDPIFKCDNIAGYAKACSSYTCYDDWRSVVNCPSICPTGMTWSYRYNRNCQKSCFRPDPCPPNPNIITNTTCDEGCVCDESTVWNERTGLCIEASKCNDSTEWTTPPYVGEECSLIPDEEHPNQLTCELISPQDKVLLENCGKACDCAILKMRPKRKIKKIKKKKITIIKFRTGNVNSCFRKISKANQVKQTYKTSDFSEQEEIFQTKCYESCGCLVENKGRRGKYSQSTFNKCFKGKLLYHRKKSFYAKWYKRDKSMAIGAHKNKGFSQEENELPITESNERKSKKQMKKKKEKKRRS